MEKKLLLITFCIAVSISTFSQNFQDVVREAESEEELDVICQSATLGFMNTPRDIEDAVNDILKTAGIKNISNAAFVLKDCNQINNAIAKILKDENGNDVRYVLYDPNLLQNIIDKTNNSWSAKFVLAHEIGHHMLGHSLNNGSSNHKYELDADYWAGRALSMMGASEEETTSATMILPERPSASHPARNDRMEKAKEGWNSVERTRVIKVRDEDINEIAKTMVSGVTQNLMENYSILTAGDFAKNLQALNHARTKYYKAYTEDIRYLEAICLTGMNETERAETAYINYLSIENVSDKNRIKQIVSLYVDAETAKSAFFQNPEVLFQICNEYYTRDNYEKAITFGNQFQQFSNPEKDKDKISEVNKIIGMSEYKRIMNDIPDEPTPETIKEETPETKPEPKPEPEPEPNPEPNPEPAPEKIDYIAEGNSYFNKNQFSDAYTNFIVAAKLGNAYAQEKVAWMLFKGKGVGKDKDAAIDWWRKAAKQGNIDAINILTRLGEW